MGNIINKFKIIFLAIIFLCVNQAYSNSVPISEKDCDNLLKPEKKIEYTEEKSLDKSQVIYVQKQDEFKAIEQNKIVEETKENNKNEKLEKSENIKVETAKTEDEIDKKSKKDKISRRKIRLKQIDAKDRIISESSRKINAIYPIDDVSSTNNYPGYRGPNQLVLYLRDYGKTTGTNEFGKEAIVVDNVVVALTGANSNIPRNGYVLSGHGNAKKWISDNLKIGTQIDVQDRVLRAYTTIDSYRYYAKSKIDAVEDVLMSTKFDYDSRDDKFIYYYLKKAKQQYRKSKKDSSDSSLNYAKESIRSASLAFRYTLPYLKDELKGVWIRPNQKSIQEVKKTLDNIKDTGINNVFLETYFHGRTIFPSMVMKKYGFEEQNPELDNFDMLAVWIREAHRRDIKVHVWFESFYVGNKKPELFPNSILAVKPSWNNKTKQKADYEGYVVHPQEHNGYFLDPANPEVVEFLLALIKEIVTRYNVDGLNIDYVRYPNISKENYGNQWGYTKYAREDFYKIYGVDPIEIKPRGSEWEDWSEYRKDKITNYIKRVSELLTNRNIVFSAVIFPDYKVSIQTKFQDWAKWIENGYLDAVTPLILTGDDNLAKSMLEEISKKTQDNAKVYPGLFAGFIESDPEDLLRQIHIARKLKLKGIILFDWAHLNNNYKDVLKTSVFRQKSY